MDIENNQPFYSDKKPNYLKEILQWILVALGALIIAIVIRGLIFEFVMVQGPSMENTLFTGQRLVVYKLGYNLSIPKRGDIIVFVFQEGEKSYIPVLDRIPYLNELLPKKGEIDYIKRVIGVPGDEIDIRDGFVYVNGKKSDEPYAVGYTNEYSKFKYPIKVPPDKIFALGDHREYSTDCRQIGFIDMNRIKGKAVFRIFPFKDFGKLK